MAFQPKHPQDYILPPPHGWGLYYDPLYGYIPISPLIRRALDLPSMQRLRRIKQLSTVELVFSGATHSRFEHSVGVYWLTTRVFDRLFDKRAGDRKKEHWPSLGWGCKLALQLAALFHDIGHGPGSHVFEIFCDRHPDFREFKHEKSTEKLIREGIGDYRDIPEFLSKLHTRLRKEGVADADFVLPENVSCIATGPPPSCDNSYLFLSQIVSSDFDVDRMDYLCRDAMHTGVNVGSVDIWEIIHNFTLQPMSENGTTIWQARLEKEASQAMEALFTARDLAYRKIYYNKTHRTAQEMLTLALSKALTKRTKEQLAMLTDDELLQLLHECGPLASDIAQRITFRRIYEPLPFEVSLDLDLDEGSRRQISRYTLPKSVRESEKVLEFFESVSKDLGLSEELSIIFDLEPTPLTRKEAFILPCLYDEEKDQDFSLIDILPHLQLLHGEDTIGQRKYDHHEQYTQHTHQILIMLPFEFLSNCIDLIEEQLKGEVGDYPIEPTQIHSAAKKVYDEKLKLIINRFNEWIGLEDPTRKASLTRRFEEKMIDYLTILYSDREDLA